MVYMCEKCNHIFGRPFPSYVTVTLGKGKNKRTEVRQKCPICHRYTTFIEVKDED